MSVKVFFQFFTILLAINFCHQSVALLLQANGVQIEIDADGDSEEEKSEKEGDKFSDKSKMAGLQPMGLGKTKSICLEHVWIAPTIEKRNPPPKLT